MWLVESYLLYNVRKATNFLDAHLYESRKRKINQEGHMFFFVNERTFVYAYLAKDVMKEDSLEVIMKQTTVETKTRDMEKVCDQNLMC